MNGEIIIALIILEVVADVEFNKNSYVPFLRNFLNVNQIKSVCDLGCGDWLCGKLIYDGLNVKYTGYDAYNKMIESHNKNFSNENVIFEHLDILNEVDKIKPADLYILKDVIQHWTIKEIYTFLDNLVESKKVSLVLINNSSGQNFDDQDEPHRSRPLSANFFPLKKYSAVIIYKYQDKEVSLIKIK